MYPHQNGSINRGARKEATMSTKIHIYKVHNHRIEQLFREAVHSLIQLLNFVLERINFRMSKDLPYHATRAKSPAGTKFPKLQN